MLTTRCVVGPALASVGNVAAFECSTFSTSITITAPSYEPAFPPFQNHYESVAFLNAITANNASSAPSPFAKVVNVTETFDISAEYCEPSGHHPRGEDVQVLTHGIGFDKSYWNFGGAASEYNYVRAATEAGYATLSYDRIGNGLSTIANPYTIQQAPIELAVLTALTTKLRNGTLDACVPKPSGLVLHVGHSYGSLLTNVLAASAPSLTDGIALTGYSLNSSFQGQFLINSGMHLMKENHPARFANRSTGFLTWPDELANQYSFFAFPFFDPAVLAYVEAHKFPFSLAELLTETLVPVNASAFTGPALVSLTFLRWRGSRGSLLTLRLIQVIAGDADLIYCGGDCYDVFQKDAAYFSSAQPFETYIQPHTGHGMNLHFNASGTYEVVQSFFKAHA